MSDSRAINHDTPRPNLVVNIRALSRANTRWKRDSGEDIAERAATLPAGVTINVTCPGAVPDTNIPAGSFNHSMLPFASRVATFNSRLENILFLHTYFFFHGSMEIMLKLNGDFKNVAAA